MASDKAAQRKASSATSRAAAQSTFRNQPRQQRSRARVEQILAAAAKVFWEVGYDAATTQEIARQANTAVGTLYRFFPNKLAIFHALEKQHRQDVENIQAQLVSPEFAQLPLADMVQQTVKIFASYFEDLGSRVVYTQYYTHPELYAQFDAAVDYSYIRRFAILLRMRNPQLSIDKSELVAEICHRTFNAIFLRALGSEHHYKHQLYQELQQLLTNYLKTYDPLTSDTTCHKLTDSSAQSTSTLTAMDTKERLTPRQQIAFSHIQQHGRITIQTFERLCPHPSRRTLQRDLRQLIDKGLIETTGDTNQLSYRLRTEHVQSNTAEQ
ncbi:MAG: TetR/AcrR family transcriptional regulator [Cyanobacteria bacterium J06623_4]